MLRLGALFGTVGLMHLLGWGVLLLVVVPQYPKLLGPGILAYTLGLRHAFDADHISAIDNTTRKFLQDGRCELGTGLFFSLGHASVVLVLAVALAVGTRTVGAEIPDFHEVGSVVGAGVSGSFLWIIGILNLLVLRD